MAEKTLTTKAESREAEVWDPFREFHLQPFGSLFEDIFPTRGLWPSLPALPKAWMPRADVQETDKEYLLSIALPGLKKEDVKIDVKDGVLTASGEHTAEKEEKGKTWLRREMSYGSFQRSFTLPEGTHPEDVKATMKDGVLCITLPKPPQPQKSRGVAVKVE